MKILLITSSIIFSTSSFSKWRYLESCRCIYKDLQLVGYAITTHVQMRVSRDEIFFTSALPASSYEKRYRKKPIIIGTFFVNQKKLYDLAARSVPQFFKGRSKSVFEIIIDNKKTFSDFVVLKDPSYKMLYKGKKHKELLDALLSGNTVVLNTEYYKYDVEKAYPTFSLDGFKEAVDKYIRPPVIEIKDTAI